MALAAVLAGATVVAASRRHVRDPGGLGRSSALSATPLGQLMLGLLIAVLATAVAAAGVRVAQRSWLYATYLDHDETELYDHVQVLIEAGSHEAAAGKLRERLVQPASGALQRRLKTDVVTQLTLAGDVANDVEERQRLWSAAASAAKEFGLSASEPAAKLDALAAERKIKHERQRRMSEFLVRSAELKQNQQFQQLYVLLAGQMELDASERPGEVPELLVDCLICWGDVIADERTKLARYREAARVAKDHGVDGRLAESRIAAVEASKLPANLRVRVLQTVATHDGHGLDIRFVVEDGLGVPWQRLRSQHVHVTSRRDGASRTSELTRSDLTETSASLVVLLDESPSTVGYRADIHRAALAFVADLPAQTAVSFLRFAERIERVSGFTQDVRFLERRLSIPFAGRLTALRGAIRGAVRELQSRAGDRLLVVITDGRDTTQSRIANNELVKECRQAHVRVFCVGLDRGDLDEQLLRELAQQTGGMYRRASAIDEMLTYLSNLRRDLCALHYRLTLADTPMRDLPDLRLAIGDGTRPTIVVPLDAT